MCIPQRAITNVYQDAMKIRVIGDHNVGRRCLVMLTVNNEFQLDHDWYINPIQRMTGFYLTKMKLDWTPYNVNITMDQCAGEWEDIEKFRSIGYFMTDVFLVCFPL